MTRTLSHENHPHLHFISKRCGSRAKFSRILQRQFEEAGDKNLTYAHKPRMKKEKLAEQMDKANVQKQYWAFISYSSKDKRWGEWLHRRLESYPIPPEFRGLEVFDGAVLGKNLRPIFRDRDELAGSADLGEAIHEALQASRFLVVLCSKNAAKSKWVNKEIEDFRAMGKGGNILALILDGEPNATIQGHPDEECFPPALRYPVEPIAGDLRKEGDGKERGFLKVLAGIAQLDFDKLYRRHERVQAKKRLVAGVITFALIASFAGLSIWAWSQKQAAEKNEQRVVTEMKRANKESEEKQRNLEVASDADLASALKSWQEDFDAQQKGERVVGFHGKSRWHEAVALLVRALKRNPANQRAAAWLFDTLNHQGYSRRDIPSATLVKLGDDNSGLTVVFSPDCKHLVEINGGEHHAQVWDVVVGKPVGEPMRHADAVISAAFSSDGTRVVTASEDKTASIWDTFTGKPISKPIRHEGDVTDVAFSPDGTRVVTASKDKRVCFWDATTGKSIGKPLCHEDEVTQVAFSPNGSHIITVCGTKTVRFWDVATGKPVSEPLRNDGSVTRIAFSPDSSLVITADVNSPRVWLWDVATGKSVCELMQHRGGIRNIAFSPDGTRVVTASDDHTAQIWDVGTHKSVGEPLRHEGSVTCAIFSPDGTQVATASSDKSVRVWNVSTGRPICDRFLHAAGVEKIAFDQNGMYIVSLSGDHIIQVWRLANNYPVGEPLRHEASVTCAAFSPDGTRVATASSDKTARVWSMVTGKPIGEPMRHAKGVNKVAFSPDGTCVLTVGDDNVSQVWNATTGKAVGKSMRHADGVGSAAFSPDGSRVVTTSSPDGNAIYLVRRTVSDDNTAQVWNAATGYPIGEPMRHEHDINSAVFNPDGSLVVTASDDRTARLWNAVTGRPIGEPLRHKSFVNSAVFSPDGTRVVTASDDKTACIWDVKTGKSISEPLLHRWMVSSAVFNPDGSSVLTSLYGSEAKLWNAYSGAPFGESMMHMGLIKTAAFSRDGRYIVTASKDASAQIWDATTGKSVGERIHHGNNLHTLSSAAFSPDSMHVVTASEDATARIWDCPPSHVMVTDAVLSWVSGIAGLNYDQGGQLQEIPVSERLKLVRKRDELPEEWRRIACWIFDNGPDRLLHPNSRFTARQIAERERDTLLGEGLESSLCYDPTVPFTRTLLAAAWLVRNNMRPESERDVSLPRRAAFMRMYDVKLLGGSEAYWAALSRESDQLKDAVLGSFVDCDCAAKNYVSASTNMTRLIELRRQQGEPLELAKALMVQGQIASILHHYSDAFVFLSESLAIAVTHSVTNVPWLCDANSSLCWSAILIAKNAEALTAAEKAVFFLKDDDIPYPARMNLAHAYLFNGQFEKAKAIYVKYLGTAFDDGRKWDDELRNDFKTLRKAGRDHPDMKKIEALLESAGK